ncbi:MAG: serine acetyltransferase [Lachnospiraceae bacterium]|nr:serine acetyltransferase [Lachnospiraceae bacterium]
MNIYNWYRVERWLWLHHIPILPQIIKVAIRIIWASVLPYQAEIGENTIIGYQGLGVVIHKSTVIGKNCIIRQNVTFGGGGGPEGGVPILGDNVSVGANSVILGNVHIGNNVTIGAGAVVVTDIPDNAVAVGVPARVIKIRDVVNDLQ